jgi:MFS family permease
VTAPAPRFSGFVVLWSGQFVSTFGTFLADFALGIFVYRLTGSATALGLVLALPVLPLILISPLAGSLVDRWDNRRALLVGDAGAMVVALVLALLLITDTFQVWHVYLVVTASSVLLALQLPAFESSIPRLAPKHRIGQANGMRQFANAVSQVLAPVLGGVLLVSIGIHGIVLINCLSYAVAVVTLLFIRIPRARDPDGSTTADGRGVRQAWRYLVDRPGLLALMIFLGVISAFIGFVEVLINPLVLAFASPGALGAVLSTGGVGMIVGSVVMSVRGPRRRIRAVLGFAFLLGMAVMAGSLRPSVPLMAAAAFVLLFSTAVIVTCSQSIWQTKVDQRLMGRTMATKNSIVFGLQFVGFVLAGPIADHVFQPLVGRDHVRSPVVAALVGNGPGRGFALLLMVVGGLIAVLALASYAYPGLRNVEDELPDKLPDMDRSPAGDLALAGSDVQPGRT